ncbi:hypothetical protein AAFC00_003027 [Neodothiora populina]|uniref:tRNA-dihydrouridine(16/17) synthase [NAD(P)(+)] n=1 Tax=Neodothiora populina TaxID=2781224 RepID=A0ABR3P9A7_9PEZI
MSAPESKKLFGREFYKSIGSPKMILAPMVEQSEFAWRMLSRSYMTPETNHDLLAYTPMFHSRMFVDTPKYRESHFQPIKTSIASPPDAYHTWQYSEQDQYLDGNTRIDRPLFVQFCANKPEELLAAARHVQPFCDAVDLNLGCPQGIAKRGNYGSFLQEDWDTIYKLINTLHLNLDIPVTAKMRILDTKEKTLDYARMILSAGASILTVHGRQRHQKGHNTGLADWQMIRFLRENLPADTVLFANGNILQHQDMAACLEATGADGVMSAEGNLYDPTIFARPPPVGQEGREYWRGKDGKGGYRMDGVLRRYMDIIHRYVLGQEAPARAPLFIASDAATSAPASAESSQAPEAAQQEPSSTSSLKRPASAEDSSTPNPDSSTHTSKKQKQEPPPSQQKKSKPAPCTSPNLVSMQAHLFHLLRPLVSQHTAIRDALARSRAGDMDAFERVLSMVEDVTREGLMQYDADPEAFAFPCSSAAAEETTTMTATEGNESSLATQKRCRRPWFVVQPYVRPLPAEALLKGSMQLTKKEKKALAAAAAASESTSAATTAPTPGQIQEEMQIKERQKADDDETRAAGLQPEGRVETLLVTANGTETKSTEQEGVEGMKEEGKVQTEGIPKEGMVCG